MFSRSSTKVSGCTTVPLYHYPAVPQVINALHPTECDVQSANAASCLEDCRTTVLHLWPPPRSMTPQHHLLQTHNLPLIWYFFRNAARQRLASSCRHGTHAPSTSRPISEQTPNVGYTPENTFTHNSVLYCELILLPRAIARKLRSVWGSRRDGINQRSRASWRRRLARAEVRRQDQAEVEGGSHQDSLEQFNDCLRLSPELLHHLLRDQSLCG